MEQTNAKYTVMILKIFHVQNITAFTALPAKMAKNFNTAVPAKNIPVE